MISFILILICSANSVSNVRERAVFKVGEPLYRATAVLHLTTIIQLPDVQTFCADVNATMIKFLTSHSDEVATIHTWHQHMAKRNLEHICQASHRWDNPMRARPKRQAALVLGGLSVITSLFSFAWSNSKINQAIADIQALENRFHKSTLLIQDNHVAIIRINAKLKEQAEQLQIIARAEDRTATRLQFLERLAMVDKLINLLHLEVSLLNEVWDGLMDAKLNPNILSPEGKENIDHLIKDAAAALGGQIPLYQGWQSLQFFPAAFQLSDNTLTIVVHLPVAAEQFNSYHYISTPHQGSILQGGGTSAVTINAGHNDLLLITKDDGAHVETSAMTITQQCATVAEVFFCNELPPLARKFEDSCLGALFKALPRAIQRHCLQHNVTADWLVSPADDDVITVYSRFARSVEVICEDSRTLTRVFGIADIKVPAGCLLSSDVFMHHRPKHLTGNTHVTRDLKWDDIDFPPQEEEMHRQLQRAIQGILNSSIPIGKPEEVWTDIIEDSSANHESISLIVALVTSGILVLLVIVLAVLTWRCRLLARRLKNNAPPPEPSV